MRRQQRARKRMSACLKCFPLLRVSEQLAAIPDPPAGSLARVTCPYCKRELVVAVDAHSLATKTFLDHLRAYGGLVERSQGISNCLYSFTVDGEVILADPPCGCEEPCEKHPRLNLTIEGNHNEALRLFEQAKRAGENVSIM